jgi:hypothetical protein
MKLIILSPIQGNEVGHEWAEDHQGVWSNSGINNDKELARSMTVIYGVFPMTTTQSDFGTETILTISNPKTRYTGPIDPFRIRVTGSGQVSFMSKLPPKHSDVQTEHQQPPSGDEEIPY